YLAGGNLVHMALASAHGWFQQFIDSFFLHNSISLIAIWFLAGWLFFPLLESWRTASNEMRPVIEHIQNLSSAGTPPPLVDTDRFGWSLCWRFLPFYGVAIWFAIERCWMNRDLYVAAPLVAFGIGVVGYLVIWALW